MNKLDFYPPFEKLKTLEKENGIIWMPCILIKDEISLQDRYRNNFLEKY
jgi:hypothetical protein